MIESIIYNGKDTLTYSLKDGKEHTINVDHNFATALASLFIELSCRPHLTITPRQVAIDNPYFWDEGLPWQMLFHEERMPHW